MIHATEVDRLLARSRPEIARYSLLLKSKRYDEANDLYMASEGVQACVQMCDAVREYEDRRGGSRRLSVRQVYVSRPWLHSAVFLTWLQRKAENPFRFRPKGMKSAYYEQAETKQ